MGQVDDSDAAHGHILGVGNIPVRRNDFDVGKIEAPVFGTMGHDDNFHECSFAFLELAAVRGSITSRLAS